MIPAFLGLDVGTNSIGWMVLNNWHEGKDKSPVAASGVYLFPEGVASEKGIEKPAAAERRKFRSARRLKFRRRLRKYHVLKLLIEHGMCPLTQAELDGWVKYRKGTPRVYPAGAEFHDWLRTDVVAKRNPYVLRAKAAEEPLLPKELGRAIYHLAQRRGYKSGRLDGEDRQGVVSDSISHISQALNGRTLGQYFNDQLTAGEKVRGQHTGREEHYVAEFKRWCETQPLLRDDVEFATTLRKALFDQRPLRSQKGLVGSCPFENNKPRIPTSHPDFEEFRMLQFLNSLRYRKPGSEKRYRLTPKEREAVLPLFFRKSKDHFDFAEIAKKFPSDCEFNRPGKMTVYGCPVSTRMAEFFGPAWANFRSPEHTSARGNSTTLGYHEAWNALIAFDDDEKLCQFAENRLGLARPMAEKFAKLRLRQGYAQLSLCAIRKILPHLRQGLDYSDAVFLANLPAMAPVGQAAALQQDVQFHLAAYRAAKDQARRSGMDFTNTKSAAERIHDCLETKWGIAPETIRKRLYHPSTLESGKPRKKNGVLQLPPVNLGAIRNPMVNRALTQLRKLLNTLLLEGTVTPHTAVHIELAHELNDANQRKAWQNWQKTREEERQSYAARIQEHLGGGAASDNDILKYQLWEEQAHTCLYTGQTIGLAEFLGQNPLYDIEHTVPRSQCGDDSQTNKTLCALDFNRNVKRGILPRHLVNWPEIDMRLKPWRERAAALQEQLIRARNKARAAGTVEDKNTARVRFHELRFELNYWRDKVRRFDMEEVPQTFRNRQLVNTGIINTHAVNLIKSVFLDVLPVNGEAVALARKLWGLQEIDCAKDRSTHLHHLVDAAVIATLGKREFDAIASWFGDAERDWRNPPAQRPPWRDFVKDVKNAAGGTLAKHQIPDRALKQAKRKLHQGDPGYAEGENRYAQGHAVRGALHKETFYAHIRHPETGELTFVVSKKLDAVNFPSTGKLNDILDRGVREAVVRQIQARLDAGQKMAEALSTPIWMNKDKKIPIRKVRCKIAVSSSPFPIKTHREPSRHGQEYKQWYYANNSDDGNYSLVVYWDGNRSKTSKIKYKIVRLYDIKDDKHFPSHTKMDEVPIWGYLKKGSVVFLYQSHPDEIKKLSPTQQAYRLYRVTQMEKDGRIHLRFHLSAGEEKTLPKPESSLDFSNASPRLRLSLRTFLDHALLAGRDFELTRTGVIRLLLS